MEKYWNQICGWIRLWHALFTMCSIVLVMSVISMFIAPPESAAYFVNIFNIVFLVPTIGALVYVMHRCHRR